MAVEFALVLVTFLTLIFGALDLARWLYSIDAVTEASRIGARVAVVCNKNASAISKHMAVGLATVSGGTATISYLPDDTCLPVQTSPTNGCTGAIVTLAGYTVPRLAWFLPAMTVPTVRTYLPRESMDSTNNARCS
jgi:Flp pilus assembly protein TadG